jgi:CBS domain-containing protein
MPTVLSDLRGLATPEALAAVPTRVGEVMTREVMTLSPQQSFLEALSLLARHRFRHLLVMDVDKRLAGVISDRDLLRFMTRRPNLDDAAVADFMKRDPVTVHTETPLSTAIVEMLTRRINCLPVVDAEGRVEGILTSTDLLRVFQHVQEWIEQRAEEPA